MTRWAALALGLLTSLGGTVAVAQRPGRSLAVTAMAVASDPVWIGGGLSFGVPVSSFVRLRANGAVGSAGGEALARAELLAELVLDPRTRGWTPFAGGGLAAVGGPGAELLGRLVLVVGVEQRPAAGRGWRIEAGLGGGARAAVGYRLAL